MGRPARAGGDLSVTFLTYGDNQQDKSDRRAKTLATSLTLFPQVTPLCVTADAAFQANDESDRESNSHSSFIIRHSAFTRVSVSLQKGGVPAAPSGTATLLRLSPNHQFYPRPVIPVFRHPRLSWLDGRCVQGPGTYSPRHG